MRVYLLLRVVSCPCFSALLRFSRLIGRLHIGIHTYIYICIHILHVSSPRCSPVTYSQCLCYPITYRPAFFVSLYIHHPMSLNLSCLRFLSLSLSFSDSRFFLFRIALFFVFSLSARRRFVIIPTRCLLTLRVPRPVFLLLFFKASLSLFSSTRTHVAFFHIFPFLMLMLMSRWLSPYIVANLCLVCVFLCCVL